MSMYTALSGISAAQSDISVTSHNIANVGTYGFKTSRVEFADIFSTSPNSVARTATGSGVQVAATAQNFTQGNVTSTNSVLDLAIEGAGFFAIRTTVGTQLETQFTRAGAFRRDVDGTIVNSAGSALLGWPVAQDGGTLSTDASIGAPLRVPSTLGAPKATELLSVSMTFPSDASATGSQGAVPPVNAFSPADPSSYAYSTPVSVLNADGTPRSAELYMVKVDAPDALDASTTWQAHLVIDGEEIAATGGTADIVFDGAGKIASGGTANFSISGLPLELSFAGTEISGKSFSVNSLSHDGKVAASLYAIEVDTAGTVFASYANGESVAMGKIFLANFPNPQGLRQVGATALSATALSGSPILGSPGETGYGHLRSGALERSNVDLTQELVNLITAQRNYQASAKAMETSSSLSQTIINMRT